MVVLSSSLIAIPTLRFFRFSLSLFYFILFYFYFILFLFKILILDFFVCYPFGRGSNGSRMLSEKKSDYSRKFDEKKIRVFCCNGSVSSKPSLWRRDLVLFTLSSSLFPFSGTLNTSILSFTILYSYLF